MEKSSKMLTILFLICSALQTAFSEDVTITCSAPPVEKGKSAQLTCNLNHDVSQLEPYSVSVDHYTYSDNNRTEVVSCQKLENVTVPCHGVAEGYTLNGAIGTQLRLTIKEASEKTAGRYVCQFMSPKLDSNLKAEPCSFRLKGVTPIAKPTTTPSSAFFNSGADDKDDPQSKDDSSGIIPIAAGAAGGSVALILVVVAIVIIVKRRRNKERDSEKTEAGEGEAGNSASRHLLNAGNTVNKGSNRDLRKDNSQMGNEMEKEKLLEKGEGPPPLPPKEPIIGPGLIGTGSVTVSDEPPQKPERTGLYNEKSGEEDKKGMDEVDVSHTTDPVDDTQGLLPEPAEPPESAEPAEPAEPSEPAESADN